ncbi:hypothetical protein T492DRAFT_857210, partial [Pavlovales sp. CCMP2436]
MGVSPMEAAARIKKQLIDTIGTIAARGHAQLLLARLSALAPIAAQLGNTTNSNQQIISLNALARAHYRRSIGTRDLWAEAVLEVLHKRCCEEWAPGRSRAASLRVAARDACTRFDAIIHTRATHALGVSLDDDQLATARLALPRRYWGAGLRRMVDIAPAAFCGAMTQAVPNFLDIVDEPTGTITQHGMLELPQVAL